MNVPKAKILVDSCEEQDSVFLLNPWRVALPCTCPRGRRLAWTRAGEMGLVRAVSTGQYSAEMHNRLDLLAALKAHGQYYQPYQH